MALYIARRAAMAASVILVAMIATFVLFFVGPSDPARSMCGDQRCTPERLADIRHSMKLDRPVPEQFTEYFKGVFVGRDDRQRRFHQGVLGALPGLLVPHRP